VKLLTILLLASVAVALGAPARAGERVSNRRHLATISVTALVTTTARIDLGRPGPSLGDEYVFKAVVYNKKKTPNPVGRFVATCVSVEDSFGVCTAIYTFALGRIIFQGTAEFGSFFSGVIIGGSGAYEGATGTMEATEVPGFRGKRNVFVSMTLP
jgi:hypothetical protein